MFFFFSRKISSQQTPTKNIIIYTSVYCCVKNACIISRSEFYTRTREQTKRWYQRTGGGKRRKEKRNMFLFGRRMADVCLSHTRYGVRCGVRVCFYLFSIYGSPGGWAVWKMCPEVAPVGSGSGGWWVVFSTRNKNPYSWRKPRNAFDADSSAASLSGRTTGRTTRGHHHDQNRPAAAAGGVCPCGRLFVGRRACRSLSRKRLICIRRLARS